MELVAGPNAGLGTWPARRARIAPGHTALLDPRRSLTYAELAARTARYAGALRRLGVGPGDRVAYLRTQGFRHGPADVLARIAQGEIVDPSLYYFRVQMLFETASTTYGWLNRTVAVGAALRTADAVVYDAYRVT